MPKFRVYAAVSASKYLGEFDAETKEEAEEIAINSAAASICLCHQCSSECEAAEVTRCEAEEIDAP